MKKFNCDIISILLLFFYFILFSYFLKIQVEHNIFETINGKLFRKKYYDIENLNEDVSDITLLYIIDYRETIIPLNKDYRGMVLVNYASDEPESLKVESKNPTNFKVAL